MIKFYYHTSPNPVKVALMLEESGLAYELVPVDTRKGEQHSPEYKKINPNAKTPAIVDGGIRGICGHVGQCNRHRCRCAINHKNIFRVQCH